MTSATAAFTESEVEDAALEWLERPWLASVVHGPSIGPDTRNAERSDYSEVVLEHRLLDALDRLNPDLPAEALDDAFRKLTRPEGSTLAARNRAFHRMLVDGVTVEYRSAGGAVCGAQVLGLDFEKPANNDWLAVNQFTVVDGEHERRPDVVLFVNGLPLGLIELKNPADEKATVWTAWHAAPDLQGGTPQAVRISMLCLSLRTELTRVSVRSRPRGNGSNRGARWTARRWPARICPSCR